MSIIQPFLIPCKDIACLTDAFSSTHLNKIPLPHSIPRALSSASSHTSPPIQLQLSPAIKSRHSHGTPNNDIPHYESPYAGPALPSVVPLPPAIPHPYPATRYVIPPRIHLIAPPSIPTIPQYDYSQYLTSLPGIKVSYNSLFLASSSPPSLCLILLLSSVSSSSRSPLTSTLGESKLRVSCKNIALMPTRAILHQTCSPRNPRPKCHRNALGVSRFPHHQTKAGKVGVRHGGRE